MYPKKGKPEPHETSPELPIRNDIEYTSVKPVTYSEIKVSGTKRGDHNRAKSASNRQTNPFMLESQTSGFTLGNLSYYREKQKIFQDLQQQVKAA